MSNAHTQAIQAALSSNWEQAISYNQEILGKDPNDVEALNRLAFAHTQTGDYPTACDFYKKVLELDKYNQIAVKNLKKYDQQDGSKVRLKSNRVAISPTLFLEEPGKTKVVTLINNAPSSVIIALGVGEEVTLVPKRFTIEVRDSENVYLGALPDDLSFHLRQLIEKGNEYQIYIKGISKNSITIFIKEIKRAKSVAHRPTFESSDSNDFYSFVPGGVFAVSEESEDGEEDVEE